MSLPPASLDTTAETTGIQPVTGGAFGPKSVGWALFEWARNPYYNVVVISVFAPYFASQVIDNGSMGQTLVSAAITIAGIIMAIVAPILGGIADHGGRKKPFILVTLLVLAGCAMLLSLITPDLPGAIPLGMVLLITGYCAYSVSELLHNAMLPGAGAPATLPLTSGLGIALGNSAAVLVLILIFIASTVQPFGLGEVDVARLSAPAVGVWLLVFMTPFFLLMPDVYTRGATWRAAIATARSPENRVKPIDWVKSKFKQHPNVMRYLLARMIYADAMAALLTLGGVYVAGVLGWSGMQLPLIGVIGAISAVVGALTAGIVDRTIGPKKSLLLELTGVIITLFVLVSISKQSLLFGLVPADHVVWEGGIFPTLADMTYVILTIPLGIFLGASIASSRYMLVHISPPDKIGEFFGFYAMSGSVTVWLGPGIVGIMTWLSGSERIGFAGIFVLIALGIAILTTVKSDKTPEHMKTSS